MYKGGCEGPNLQWVSETRLALACERDEKSVLVVPEAEGVLFSVVLQQKDAQPGAAADRPTAASPLSSGR